MSDYQVFSIGPWTARVPVSLIERHCQQHDHLFCVPDSLMLECQELLLREAVERRLSREYGVPVHVII